MSYATPGSDLVELGQQQRPARRAGRSRDAESIPGAAVRNTSFVEGPPDDLDADGQAARSSPNGTNRRAKPDGGEAVGKSLA